MPALEPYLIEPIFEQFLALLPTEWSITLWAAQASHPRRVILEKLVQILVFGCAYRRIAEEGCSATAIGDDATSGSNLG